MFSSNSSTVSGDANYIEDVFSTYLYTGTGSGSAQTINNGINLSGKGGLVWIKDRTVGYSHSLFDTARGVTLRLLTNGTGGEILYPTSLTAFNSNGFTIGDFSNVNSDGSNLVSWTFRKQPKFFDVVTWTSQAGANTVAHNLGSAPGFIVMKSLTNPDNWWAYHRSLGNNKYIVLNQASGSANSTGFWNTSTTTFGYGNGIITAGEPMVAYIYAHDAGGFGLAGTDNVISCGNYTGVAYPDSQEVNVGFEPQWVMIKNTTTASGWSMWDSMRGMAVVPAANVAQAQLLEPNTSAAEGIQPGIYPTATGFVVKNGLTAISGLGDNFIYIAIRRGPMKVPTDGTKVFAPVLSSASASVLTSNFPVDMAIAGARGESQERGISDRLRGFATSSAGSTPWLVTQTTQTEGSYSTYYNATNTAIQTGSYFGSISLANYLFRRAPGFFDEVCYTGTGSAQTLTHNLGVAPLLMIVKGRNATAANQWRVYDVFNGNDNYMALNTTAATASGYGDYWNSTTPTASAFYVGTSNSTNTGTYVAYLFATCPGVSKVTNFTGNGSSQTINCGFTSGARFVMIKATSTTGNWTVFDSARGISAGGDPALYLNSTAAEVTGIDAIDADSTGFVVNQEGTFNLNASGVEYLVLAIS